MLTAMGSLETWESDTRARSWLPGTEKPALSAQDSLHRLLTMCEPITLAQAGNAALQDRSEIKYVMQQSLLPPILAQISDTYRVLVVAGQPVSHYRTLYFDTADLAMYRRHHAGAPDRYKVRVREYINSHAAFLEVKHKTKGQRTVKSRIPVRGLVSRFSAQEADFLAEACPYPAQDLAIRLWSQYARITLVSRTLPERVTLDLDLTFLREGRRVALAGIVVAEVKYEGARHASQFAQLMHEHHVRNTGFSKYCMGVTLLYPEVKHNRFKAKQLLVTRLMQGVRRELY